MVDRIPLLAAVLLAATALTVASPMPVFVKLPLVLLCLVGAPALAVVRLQPRGRRLDPFTVVVGFAFGLSWLVIASEALALVGAWSGWLVLGLVWLVVAALLLSPAWTGDRRSSDTFAELLALRVLWRDGRVCCVVHIDRTGGMITDFEFGRRPALRPCAGRSTSPIDGQRVVHGGTIAELIAYRRPPSYTDRRMTVDLERVPVLCRTADALHLWLDVDETETVETYAAVDGWVTGTVDKRNIALGVDAKGDPKVIRVT